MRSLLLAKENWGGGGDTLNGRINSSRIFRVLPEGNCADLSCLSSRGFVAEQSTSHRCPVLSSHTTRRNSVPSEPWLSAPTALIPLGLRCVGGCLARIFYLWSESRRGLGSLSIWLSLWMVFPLCGPLWIKLGPNRRSDVLSYKRPGLSEKWLGFALPGRL